jgi:hypothetical protein
MGGFFVAVLRRKGINTPLTGEQIALRGSSKRAASQEPEYSAPDAKRVKVTCPFCEPSSKQKHSHRTPMWEPESPMIGLEENLWNLEIVPLPVHLQGSQKRSLRMNSSQS